jgi:hypothetical protein
VSTLNSLPAGTSTLSLSRFTIPIYPTFRSSLVSCAKLCIVISSSGLGELSLVIDFSRIVGPIGTFAVHPFGWRLTF